MAALRGATRPWTAGPAAAPREEGELVLQRLWLQSSLEEEGAPACAGLAALALPAAVVERTAALRELRRSGPLAEMSEEGYRTLLSGTLCEYDPHTPAAPLELLEVSDVASVDDLNTTVNFLESELLHVAVDEPISPATAGSREPGPAVREASAGSGAASPGSPRSANEESSHFWAENRTFMDGSYFGETAQTALLDTSEGLGGDGEGTFAMHALMRHLVNHGDLAAVLAQSVERAARLGDVASGRALASAEMEALPKVRFEQAEQQTCAICLEAFQQGELLIALLCSHAFHSECVTRWFQRSAQCPLCRTSQQHGTAVA